MAFSAFAAEALQQGKPINRRLPSILEIVVNKAILFLSMLICSGLAYGQTSVRGQRALASHAGQTRASTANTSGNSGAAHGTADQAGDTTAPQTAAKPTFNQPTAMPGANNGRRVCRTIGTTAYYCL